MDIVRGWPVLLVDGRYYRPLEYAAGDTSAPTHADILRARSELRERVTVRDAVTPFGAHVAAIERGNVKLPDED